MTRLLSNHNANECRSASEQKEFDESRAKREAERKKRDAYGVSIFRVLGAFNSHIGFRQIC